MRFWLSLIVLFGWVTPVGAVTRLDNSRAVVSQLRKSMGDVRREQMSLRNELNGLASKIESLKKEQKGRPSNELNQALKRSQEISIRLTQLAQELSSADEQLTRENEALLRELNAEIDALRRKFDGQAESSSRKALLEKMKSLRSEREQVRTALPKGVMQSENLNTTESDPELLLEQADALKDREEKIRRELKQLESRIRERKEEAELDKRMNSFLGDDALFDEQDRRMRLQRSVTTRNGAAGNAEGAPARTEMEKDSSPNVNVGVMGENLPAEPTPPTTPQGSTAPPVAAPAEKEAQSAVSGSSGAFQARTETFQGTDARPFVGQKHAAGRWRESDDLKSLLEEEARLKAMADDMKTKAKLLEQKARQNQ